MLPGANRQGSLTQRDRPTGASIFDIRHGKTGHADLRENPLADRYPLVNAAAVGGLHAPWIDTRILEGIDHGPGAELDRRGIRVPSKRSHSDPCDVHLAHSWSSLGT